MRKEIVTTSYRKFGKEGCSSHTIEARTVRKVVLADIQKHAGQALADRKAMVTEKRFQMLSARFDSEQEELTAKIKELEKSAIADKEQLSSIEQFAEQISGYSSADPKFQIQG